MRRYTGDRPCPGCGTPGSERSRSRAGELCHPCEKALEIGKSIQKNDQNRYANISLDPHTAKSMVIRIGEEVNYGEDMPYVSDVNKDDFNSKTLQKSLEDFISSLHVGKRPADKKIIRISNYDAMGGRTYVIPLAQAKMFFRFWNQVCGFTSYIKNKYFVEGTDLLRGLNSGKIKLSDFEERIDNAKAEL